METSPNDMTHHQVQICLFVLYVYWNQRDTCSNNLNCLNSSLHLHNFVATNSPWLRFILFIVYLKTKKKLSLTVCGVTDNTYTGTVGGAAPLIRSHLYKLHDFSMHHWHNLGFEVNLDHFKSLLSIPFIQIVVVKIHDLRTTENTKNTKKVLPFSGKPALTWQELCRCPFRWRWW